MRLLKWDPGRDSGLGLGNSRRGFRLQAEGCVRRSIDFTTAAAFRLEPEASRSLPPLMTVPTFELRPIGRVESTLTALEAAPRQADEGAPSAALVFDEDVRDGLANLRPGDQLIVLTWLDRAHRDVLVVHPRGDVSGPRKASSAPAHPIVPTPSACTVRR